MRRVPLLFKQSIKLIQEIAFSKRFTKQATTDITGAASTIMSTMTKTVSSRSTSTTSLPDAAKRYSSSFSKLPIYRNNASMILAMTVDGSSPRWKDQIRQVISIFCNYIDTTPSSAASNDSDDFKVEPLSGGLSNELFVATHGQDCYLVRLHPDWSPPSSSSSIQSCDSSEITSLVDREQETKLLAWLAEQSLAPTLHGRFENGRVEQFYSCHDPLTIPDMVTFAPKIAKLMGRLHAQAVPESILPACDCRQGSVVARIDLWFDMARGFGKHLELLQDMETEWTWLQQALRHEYWGDNTDRNDDRAILFGREIVLCHMDAQSLNFLKSKSGSVKMIDYEYSSRNPRVFDIANTFCEFADMNHMTANFSKDYPNQETQDVYLRSYLKSLGQSNPLTGLDDGQQDEFVATLRSMVARSTLVSHLSWSVWSLVQDSMAHISFDYEQYARHRLDGYRYNKKAFWGASR